MSDDAASVATGGVTYGKRAAHLPPSAPGPDWPYPTCVRFCAIPHEVGEPCRSFGDEVFLSLCGVDPETGEPRFALVFSGRPDEAPVMLTAYQASVLASELSPESLR
ncbi:hypothetical protein [Mumia zhuanghuii]|uniref:Uncharacterized protein n=1 Tax=Mumia zhuanghuii TaxID=2585211 RepID=A0A5C4MBD1_9ACTN|nr:hypothetical protein [Mumia zhuanghuii]TNC29392.1 hypothetical protein FHE65_33565 [Mumia zhuanghuii]TNC37140.1 hypothetical protein FHE65_25565 [Mumia zhuanghuii]